MATIESAVALLTKRLRKAEQAQGRLGELARRIQAQADAIAELITLTNSVAGGGRPTAARSPRPVAARKAANSRKSTAAPRKAAAPSSRKAATVKRAPARPAAKPTTAARKPAAARPARPRVVAPPELIAATSPVIAPGSAI
jgi:hypothetical protein